MKSQLAVLVIVLFAVVVTAQNSCTTFDPNGPYCTGDENGNPVNDDRGSFCMDKGFSRSEFGNGPDDQRAFCGAEDNGSGYRFNCCNEKPVACTSFDPEGPYCNADENGNPVNDDRESFCMGKGFTRSQFGNGPDDLRPFCGAEDNGSGYRFNCCNEEPVATTPTACTTFDPEGPYCTADENGSPVNDDRGSFCRDKGFSRSEFGNGPDDLRAFCGPEDRGSGYRFNCCDE